MFFFTAILAVEVANPGQLKSSILLTRRASKFGGKTYLLTRCSFVVPRTFEQGVFSSSLHLCTLWARVGCTFLDLSFFPGPFYPLSKGWFFTCHCFLLLFSSRMKQLMASARNLWQKVAPAGLFPLFHTCFSCGVVMRYTLMPFIKASCRISAASSIKTLIPWLSRYSTLPLGPHLWSLTVVHLYSPQ